MCGEGVGCWSHGDCGGCRLWGFFDQYHAKRELLFEISMIDNTNMTIDTTHAITAMVTFATSHHHFHQACYDQISTSRRCLKIALPFQTGRKSQKCCLATTKL